MDLETEDPRPGVPFSAVRKELRPPTLERIAVGVHILANALAGLHYVHELGAGRP